MGEVWLASHRIQRAQVAIKFVLGVRRDDAWALESFAEEVRATAGLAHPGIVRVLDHGVVDAASGAARAGVLSAGVPYLVMELIGGRPLSGYVGALRWPRVRSILLQILEALAHSHARGVIHRDIKPGNVLVIKERRSGKLTLHTRLSDFGLARALEREGGDAMVVGTPAFMAPEQVRGAWRDQGPWTDLYSMGCLAWSLVCGVPPFGQTISPYEQCEKHLKRTPPPLKPTHPVPAGFEAWLRRLLAKPPGSRYTNAADAIWGLLSIDDSDPDLHDDEEAPLVFRKRTARLGELKTQTFAGTLTPAGQEKTERLSPSQLNPQGSGDKDLLQLPTSALKPLPDNPLPDSSDFTLDPIRPDSQTDTPTGPDPAGSPPTGSTAGAERSSLQVHSLRSQLESALRGGVDPRASTLILRPSEATVIFPSRPDASARAEQPSAARATAAPVPESWRSPRPPETPPNLLGVGLNLYGIRAMPMVARQAERDALWSALLRVCDTRHPTAVLLHGPAGCGRSRLLEWLAERAAEVGAATILRASHSPDAGRERGLGPMLARHLRCAGQSRDELAGRLKTLLGGSEPLMRRLDALVEILRPTSDAERQSGAPAVRFHSPDERYALIRRLLAWVVTGPWGTPRGRPVILCLDDVPYGLDSLDFCRALLTTDEPLPVLMVMTARAESLAMRTEERRRLDEIAALPRVERRALGPLPEADQRSLIAALLGMEGELVDRVATRTRGNPLFAVQLVGDWVARGILEAGETGFRLQRGAEVDLPEDIHQVWSRRIGQILDGDPIAERALELAAVLGQEVSRSEWQALCTATGITPPIAVLERMRDQHLVIPRDGGWAFVHAMLREALLRQARQRGRLSRHHLACAALLQGRVGKQARARGRLGHHLLHGGRVAEATSALLEGADECLTTGDHAEARRLLAEREQALTELALWPEDERWGRGWVAAARVAIFGQDWREASIRTAHLEARARQHGWAEVQVHALRLRARLLRQEGQLDAAEALLEEGITRARELRQTALWADCSYDRAVLDIQRGRFDAVITRVGQASDGFEEVGDTYGWASCRLLLGRARLQKGDIEWARAATLAASQAFERAGSFWNIADCSVVLGEVARIRGDLAEAERCYAEATEQMIALGHPDLLVPRINLALVQIERGEHAAARRGLEAELASMREGRGAAVVGAVLVALLPPCADAGDWESFDGHLREGRERIDESGLVDVDIATMATLAGRMALDLGQPDLGWSALALARAQWRALNRPEELREVDTLMRST